MDQCLFYGGFHIDAITSPDGRTVVLPVGAMPKLTGWSSEMRSISIACVCVALSLGSSFADDLGVPSPPPPSFFRVNSARVVLTPKLHWRWDISHHGTFPNGTAYGTGTVGYWDALDYRTGRITWTCDLEGNFHVTSIFERSPLLYLYSTRPFSANIHVGKLELDQGGRLYWLKKAKSLPESPELNTRLIAALKVPKSKGVPPMLWPTELRASVVGERLQGTTLRMKSNGFQAQDAVTYVTGTYASSAMRNMSGLNRSGTLVGSVSPNGEFRAVIQYRHIANPGDFFFPAPQGVFSSLLKGKLVKDSTDYWWITDLEETGW